MEVIIDHKSMDVLRLGGKAFHMHAPLYAKDFFPISVLTCGRWKPPEEADLVLCL